MANLKKIVLATGNPGKLREIQSLLQPVNVDVVPQTELGVGNIAETGLSFVENAILKARHAADRTKLPALADDSGLEVDILQGAPGIYSARYAGEQGDDTANRAKLLNDLADYPQESRRARFQCVMAYMRHAGDPTPLIFQGTWEGTIVDTPRGSNGFGYDPIFQPLGERLTAAELPPDKKNKLSHRAKALQQMITALQKQVIAVAAS